MKDEGAIDWREGFPNFHWTRRTSSRRGHGGLPRTEEYLVFWGKGKEDNECVRKRLVLVCGRCCSWKRCV
jgi:hypothetical protein